MMPPPFTNMTQTNPNPPEHAHDIFRHPRRHSLDPLFAPRNVAIIGATEKPGTVGRALVENLRLCNRPVFPVNPTRESIQG
jgi:acetyltransferase